MKKLSITLAFGIAATVLFWVAHSARPWFRDQTREREELKRFAGDLSLGLSRLDVAKHFQDGRFTGFALIKSEREWWAKAPLVLSAKNWLVVLDFDNERLSCVRFRTEDSLSEHPLSAPPDRCLEPPGSNGPR